MKVIVDTSAWSLALRRRQPTVAVVDAIADLAKQGRVQMLGVIRQEVLSGIRTGDRIAALRTELAEFPDLPIRSEDHEHAAAAFNRCMSRGVQGNLVDMLICSVAVQHDLSIYTLDSDFVRYAKVLPIKLHKSRTS
jgi:predicted nucleic acid-binding protein